MKQSLGTKDPERAAAEFRRIEAKCAARWAEIRKGAQNLDHEQVEAIGGEVYRDLIERTGNHRGMWIHHSFAWFLYRCEQPDECIASSVMGDCWPELESLHGANLDTIQDRSTAQGLDNPYAGDGFSAPRDISAKPVRQTIDELRSKRWPRT